MNRNEVLYLVPYLISLLLSVGVFIFSWQRRRLVEGTYAYLWYLGGQTLAIFGFILEMISPSIDSKILWDAFQWLADLGILVSFPVFAIKYAGTKIRNPRLALALSAIVPGLFLAFLVTDSMHHLVYLNPQLLPESPFPELTYDFTWVVYFFASYTYVVIFTGAGLLFRHSARSHHLYRSQTTIIAIGILIPIIGTLFSTIGLKIAPQRDATPFTTAIGNLVIAWGLFRYHLFAITPIARDIVVENMDDLVVVLDAKDRIEDINHSAMNALGLTGKTIIGQPANRVFASWPVLAKEFYNPENVHKNIALQDKESIIHYEVGSTLLYNKQGMYIGRVFVARDITERIKLQKGLEELNNELEERVRERTEALRESEKIFDSFMEYSPIYIFFKDKDIRSLRLSKNYEKMLGMPIPHLLGKAMNELFPSELAENMVKDDLQILNEGQPVNIVEEFNGRIYETTKFPIFKNGKPEMLAGFTVDITERKRAERALRESETIYRQAIEVAGAVPYRQTYTGEGTSLRYDFVGDGIRNITGYGPEEFSAKIWNAITLESQVIGELAKYSFEDAVRKVRSGEISIWQCEHRIRARDGTIRWVFEAAVELRDENGISHGSIGTFEDITERKLADRALKRAHEELAGAYDATLEGWANALDLREHETAGHSRRAVEGTVQLAKQLGITGEQLTYMRRGAFLHDIGKIGIPDHILLKPSALNAEEWKIMRKHPQYGYDLLKKISFLNPSTDIPFHHHERWDGTGYPDGLKGEEIPLAARIFAVVDVWDALLSDRPYRKAWRKDKAIEYLREQSGKHFDPQIVETFLESIERKAEK